MIGQEDRMAEVPQQEPAKPAKRVPATWQVFVYEEGVLRPRGQYDARSAEAACWQAAETGQMVEQAMSEAGVKLVAIKASEIDPRTYRLRSTVERVKA